MKTEIKTQVWTAEQLIAADKILNGTRHLEALIDVIMEGVDQSENLRQFTDENWRSCVGFLKQEQDRVGVLLEIAMRTRQDMAEVAKVLTGAG